MSRGDATGVLLVALDDFTRGGLEAQVDFIQSSGDAVKDLGFVRVTGHGIDSALTGRVRTKTSTSSRCSSRPRPRGWSCSPATEPGCPSTLGLPFFVHPRPDSVLRALDPGRGEGVGEPPADITGHAFLRERLTELGLF